MTGTDLIVPAPLATDLEALVVRYHKAGRVSITLLNMLGGRAEALMETLPAPLRSGLDAATVRALTLANEAARRSKSLVPDGPAWAYHLSATGLGAAGGFGGFPGALAELPVTTTLLLRSIQRASRSHGFDVSDQKIQQECLHVFTAAGPLTQDDGANTAFFAARLTLTGATVRTAIARVAPKLATVLGQKLAAQTVPVLGAAAGAATNYTYASYYTEMAEVHFGLKRLAKQHNLDEALVRDAFLKVLALQKR